MRHVFTGAFGGDEFRDGLLITLMVVRSELHRTQSQPTLQYPPQHQSKHTLVLEGNENAVLRPLSSILEFHTLTSHLPFEVHYGLEYCPVAI